MTADIRPVNVLLVDDDDIDRMAFARFVRKGNHPFVVHEAASKRAAIALLAERAFDVVVLDYHLGDGVGLDLLPHLGDTPVIFITGGGSEEFAIQALSRGATDYMIKDADRYYLQLLPAAIRGVRERKAAELELRRSEERYRELAEFADTVIHNVGNVLNSVNASCESIMNILNRSRVGQLERVNQLLEHCRDETDFFTDHPKGKQIPDYLQGLQVKLDSEQQSIQEETQGILKRLLLVREIIETQQSQGKMREAGEPLVLSEIVEDALRVRAAALQKNGIDLEVVIPEGMQVFAPKIKLTHILINLLKNSIEAINEYAESTRKMWLLANQNEQEQVVLELRDTGVGIDEEAFKQLFRHGFTTKENGHGYGLHYCARVMKELGGEVKVFSDGYGKGARVSLLFAPPAKDASGQGGRK
ncbi:ATP-binding protein [Acanthopleuribacter pedis]|uniref:histidine kinase n=1 Tax=Acanthopleuribacter pedis TaxID=442870 RepID=A0A8J7Q928_9BACT|nr:response regulator [Acanthopleuribacter pedis]